MEVTLALVAVLLALGQLAVALLAYGKARPAPRGTSRLDAPDRDTRPTFLKRLVAQADLWALDLALGAAVLLGLSLVSYLIAHAHDSAARGGYTHIAQIGAACAILLAGIAWIAWRSSRRLGRVPVAATLVIASGTVLLLASRLPA